MRDQVHWLSTLIIHNIDLLSNPVYTTFKRLLQRVPLAAASVCRDDAVLLVDEVKRDVTAWIGADCGVFAASLAKQVRYVFNGYQRLC
jgi:hypothetical protein